MRKEYVIEQVSKVDLLADVDPKEASKDGKLSWIKRLIFIAVWPWVKPYIARKVNEKIAETIEDILEGI